MIFSWLKNQRRKALLAEPLPAQWLRWIERNVRHYAHLDRDRQARIHDTTKVVVAEKDWVGGSGFVVTDEMKVTIAAEAAVLALGMEEPYYFDGVLSIILYPGPYRHPMSFGGGEVYGEAWHRGPIVLAWREVLRGGRGEDDGRNLVFHEFAHYIDGLDGEIDGSPPLVCREQQQAWYRVTEAEYLRLLGQARRDEVSLLDHYGASNRAEFFAVATECFFEQPRAMQVQHAELYGVLRDLYRQDPAEWLPDAEVRRGRRESSPRRKRRRRRHPEATTSRQERLASLRSRTADTWFTRAVMHYHEGQYALAARAATRVLAINPHDVEALSHRASARARQGRYPEALADCEAALRLDPDDPVAYRARGAVYLGLGQYDRARQDLDRALDEDGEDAEARYLRGRVWAALRNLPRAIVDFDKSLALRPLVAEVHYHLGLAYRASGDKKAADRELDTALHLDPRAAGELP
jgi:Mlc titration factor MtfA (ptsG expression regulator)/Flp pilus assembly protein TadD